MPGGRMPTTNDRGLPLYSDTEPMPDWDVAYNAQSNALSTALDDSEQAAKDDDAVASIADLPVTGNWPGRLMMTEENDMLNLHDGSGWYVISGKLPYYFGTRADSAVDASTDQQPYITTSTASRGVSMSAGVLTFETVGIYKIDQAVVWEAHPSGQRNLGISGTGITVLGPAEAYEMPSATVETSEVHATYIQVNSPGATATPYVTHNSGASLNVYGSVCVMWVSA